MRNRNEKFYKNNKRGRNVAEKEKKSFSVNKVTKIEVKLLVLSNLKKNFN